MVRDVPVLPSFSIGMEVLEVTDHFYLASAITTNVLLDREIYKRVAKAADDLAKPREREYGTINS